MSDRARPRRNRAPLVVGALIVAVALAGCGAGQLAQTSSQVAAVAGANASVGDIDVRNATIEFDSAAQGATVYPAGADAPLSMTIVNSGADVERLVAASSPIASSVQISGRLRIPGGQALRVEGTPEPMAAPEPTGTATPTATPTAAPAPSPSEVPATPLPTAPPVVDEAGVAHIVLTGLLEDLQAGRSYPLTLTFERAGELTFNVPVANRETLREAEHA